MSSIRDRKTSGLPSKQATAADGRRNIANYTFEVVADLDSPSSLAEATSEHEIELIDFGAGEQAYALTLKGRLAGCRAVIESVTEEMREIMNEMAMEPSRKRPPSRRGRRAA